MKFTSNITGLILAFATLGVVSTTVPTKERACSATRSYPCACPTGKNYFETATLAIIGSKIADSEAFLNSFFDTAWYGGSNPDSTKGPNNKPGSIRTFKSPTSNFSELLTKYTVRRDRSFLQSYQEYEDPKTAPKGWTPGFYVTMEGRGLFQNETEISLRAHGCWAGSLPDLTASHEEGLRGAVAFLKAKGKVVGKTPSNFISADTAFGI
ncbi:hypothetical protein VFPPC_06840 [Pochonia chlamydosporia 170]|uniref:Heme haloperoxidase family profile domain-containing protein n=1 Tax=Pochonia chlamydosporia 170 TaxID=1380566 RepID=A0A179F5R8_METCM|nr:hypothetical protein VFPPC_06840 [Pochonia chlamydosporia 170]OAQ60742.1 hypothetical protein VFPPC_06840 [Pochonia chlamydosporia 170]